MAVLGVIFLFLLIGTGVIFVAYSGGPGAAREAYLTRGRTFFKITIPLLYIGLGIAVPAVVIANHNKKIGGEGALVNESPHGDLAKGKSIFQETCASCHTLKAVNARGLTGPDLDNLPGQVTPQRVLGAIQRGGTGDRRMPANLLQGEDAQAVANYVASVAGR
jgi:cytochrome c553